MIKFLWYDLIYGIFPVQAREPQLLLVKKMKWHMLLHNVFILFLTWLVYSSANYQKSIFRTILCRNIMQLRRSSICWHWQKYLKYLQINILRLKNKKFWFSFYNVKNFFLSHSFCSICTLKDTVMQIWNSSDMCGII